MRRNTTVKFLPITRLILILLVAGCSSGDKAWEEAKLQDTVESYEAYLGSNPESPYLDDCLEAIRLVRWRFATDDGSAASLGAYLKDYPEAANLDEARAGFEAAIATEEIDSLSEHLRHFLNGNEADNVIAVFNGQHFSAREQNQSSGVSYFGASNMLMAGEMRNSSSDLVLGITYEPTSNQMIARIEELVFAEGMGLEFLNGHRYVFENEVWVRRQE